MKSACSPILVCTAFFALSQAAHAGIIVDHQPHPYGGLGSDTLFTSPFGQPVWQHVADDFVWNTGEQLTRIHFWGFYNADNPPALEMFRLRLYRPRPSDGLPGQIAHEETIQNPTRTWTGRYIATGIVPKEFNFEVPLAAPVTLEENARYWLELVQIGDIATLFRWEHSTNHDFNGVSTANIIHNDWQNTYPNGPADAAFQLISPEPSSAALCGIWLCSFIRTRSRRTAA